jgi:hypothetical protein
MPIIRLIMLCCYGVILAYSSLSYAKLPPKKAVNGVYSPIQIEVAATVRSNSKFDGGIYLFKVHCALDRCSVERLSLNECTQNSKGQFSFIPKTYLWASWAGFLEANLTGNVLELVIFQGTHRQLPANITITFATQGSPFTQVKAFKATGFIDFAVWPEKDNRIEYIPIEGDQLKQLTCPVFLPGIHK